LADRAHAAERFTTRVFTLAAIYGFIGAATLYFTDAPDPHRLMYFAFAGIALVFQGVFLVIARDPRRFQPLLGLCVFEKISFAVPALAFAARGQAAPSLALGGAVDLLLAVLFAVCWRRMAISHHSGWQ
jgi:hypothetical protein